MRFLCLCYYAPKTFASLPPAELAKLGPACAPYDAALRATGKVYLQGSLTPAATWKTLRPGAGGPVVTDGAVQHAALEAGAFLVVEAEDTDEAVRVASQHAAANVGEHLGFAVEVRPCERFEDRPVPVSGPPRS